jgi:uncharacterized 2Fe-2S/4Fe-4S cluster protein (DUF4445 family)
MKAIFRYDAGPRLAAAICGARRRGLRRHRLPGHGITFSREDTSHLAQAKAANYCGQLIVMHAFGAEPGDIKRLYLAGGFANYIDVANAIAIGFLPPIAEERIVKIGNAPQAHQRCVPEPGGGRRRRQRPHRSGRLPA